MATPSSTSAYHRRRSFRDLRANGALKENGPFAGSAPKSATPPLQPADIFPTRSPAVLRARNARTAALPPTPVRELFTTPRPSPAYSGGLRAARAARAARTPGPSAAKVPPARTRVNVHAPRTVRAALAGAGVGGATALLATMLARGVLRLGRADGVVGALVRLVGLCCLTIVAFMMLVLCETVSTAAPLAAARVLSLHSARLVLRSRARVIHLLLCVAIAVMHTLLLSAIAGAFDPLTAFPDAAQLAAYTSIAAFSGLAFSFLAQGGGNLVWRFSPTRDAALVRARADLPHAVYLSVAGAGSGAVMSYVVLGALRQAALTAGVITGGGARAGGGFGVKVAATCAAFVTLLCWNLALLAFRTLMTAPIDVRRYIADVPAGAVKAGAQRNRDVVDSLLADIAPRGTGPVLTQLLAMQFFRDIARSSRPGRSAIFADASGNAWNALLVGCLAPVDALADALATAAPTRMHSVMSANGARARVAAPKASLPNFGEGRTVVWACEAISHFLVASRDEDDYGVAQRTFVHAVISLLTCKEQVDAARQRVGVAPVVVDNRGESTDTSIIARIMNYQNPHDSYFAPEVVGSAVSDALNLALFRLVDAFRVHLQGYLVGAEPHWDRRLDRALKACLDMDGI